MKSKQIMPVHEITYDNREKVLAKIKVGDRLWVGHSSFPCSRGIKQVTRVTPTLIIVGDGTNNWNRFKRNSGYQVGKAMFADRITAIATKAEVEAYEAEQLAQKREAERKQKAQDEREATRKRLCKLFGDKQIWVHNADYGNNHEAWKLVIDDLSEQDVEKLALFLAAFDRQVAL